MLSAKSTRFSGGGGSSRIFPSSPKVVAIQWGGGNSSIFPWSQRAVAIQWGVGGGSTRHFPLMGPFYIFRLSKRGGGNSPTTPPPPESATAYRFGSKVPRR